MSRSWNGAKWIRRERRLALYMRDGLACVWCGSSLEDEGVTLSLDHFIPASRGGRNVSRNLVTSCRKCNNVRRSRTGRDFAHDVAKYLDSGITGEDILSHALDCLERPVDLRAARRIMNKRASWQQALEEAKRNESRKEEQP